MGRPRLPASSSSSSRIEYPVERARALVACLQSLGISSLLSFRLKATQTNKNPPKTCKYYVYIQIRMSTAIVLKLVRLQSHQHYRGARVFVPCLIVQIS